jgi:uncharacterized repeat protein (TIGR01451 family)
MEWEVNRESTWVMRFVLLLIAVVLLLASLGYASAAITLTGNGGSAVPEGKTRYKIVLSNEGSTSGQSVISQILPEGFSYVPDSTTIRVNGQIVSQQDPVVNGRRLTWSAFSIPAATYISISHFGIHTFVQDLCLDQYVDFQLDKALDLVGEGGYVKQMFYSIKSDTTGPKPCWIKFVEGAYDRHLIPVIRLQGRYDGSRGYWVKPQADSPGNYETIAQAYRNVVEGLPMRDGQSLYIEVWNEPELPVNWSDSPSASEYANFFVDAAAAIHDIGDPRIKVLNGALTPGNASFATALMKVPGFAQSFDVWAAHCYPYNHPPNYNIHAGSARYSEYAIDSYLLELNVLARYGRPGVKVILTETGHGLGDNIFSFEGYPAINEANRADYMVRAFRDYWVKWPELIAACPFELVGPYGDWGWLDWLYPTTDVPHKQYADVSALPKPPLQLNPAIAEITFAVKVGSELGTFYSTLEAIVDGVALPPVERTVPVRVVESLSQIILPVILKDSNLNLDAIEDVVPVDTAFNDQIRMVEGVAIYTILKPGATETTPQFQMTVVGKIPMSDAPISLAVDSSNRVVYVATEDQKIRVFEPAKALESDVWELPVALSAIALDDTSDRLYGVNSEKDMILSVDTASGRLESSRLLDPGPVGIAVDSQKSLVYVACAGSSSLVVLDGGLKEVQRSHVSDMPLLGLALDDRANRIYVVLPLVPGRHGIAVLDQDTLRQIDLLGGDYEHPLTGLYGLAVDSASGLLLGFDRNMGLLIDPKQKSLLQVWPQAKVSPRAGFVFDSAAERIYVLDVDGQQLSTVELGR